MVRDGVFHGEIRGLTEFLVFCLKKLLEPSPLPMDFCRVIPFANPQSEIARTVKNDVSYVHSLVLGVRRSGDVGKIEKFFNGGEYGRYRVSRIVYCLLENVFALEELVGHQLNVVVLKVIQHFRNGVVDRIGRAVADIRKVRFLDRQNNLLHKSLLHSRHIPEQTHSLGVCDMHAVIRMGSCAVRYDMRTRVSWVDEWRG